MLVSCLCFQRVDVEVVAPAVLADDHALVDLRPRRDEHRPALLQVPQRIGDRVAGAVGDQHAVAPALDRALVGLVAVEDPVHHAGAAGVGQELALIADQAARRRAEGDAGLAAAGGTHVVQLGLALAELLDDDAGVFVVDVDCDFLDRLQPLAGLGSVWKTTRGRRIDSSKPSRRMVSISTPSCSSPRPATSKASLPSVSRDPDGDVALGLAQQAVADHAAVTLSPSRPASGLSLTEKVMAMVGGSIGWPAAARSPADRRWCRRRWP